MPADAKTPSPPASPAADPVPTGGAPAAAKARRDRLARALRDNLKKRKAQQRQREQPDEAAPGAPAPEDSFGDDSSGGGA